jgi:hypothetical protein
MLKVPDGAVRQWHDGLGALARRASQRLLEGDVSEAGRVQLTNPPKPSVKTVEPGATFCLRIAVKVHVVLVLDDEDAVAGVPVRVRVFQDVEQVATIDVEDDVFEPDAAIRLEVRVLRDVPGEILHCHQRSTTCA